MILILKSSKKYKNFDRHIICPFYDEVDYLVLVKLNFSDFEGKYLLLCIVKHKLFEKTYILKFEDI